MSDTMLVGSKIIDEKGRKIGSVADVFHDEESGRAAWVAVNLGALHHKTPLLPLQGSYRSAQGELVVPFDKTKVSHSPCHDTETAPTPTQAAELEEYFGVAPISEEPPLP